MCAKKLEAREHIHLLLRVARAYYEEGRDQGVIAQELGYSRSTVSRMLTEARERRIVRFEIGHPLEQSFEVERALKKRFGLPHAWVAASTEESNPAREVGAIAAEAISQAGGPHSMVALSNGTSVAAVVANMPRMQWSLSLIHI